MLFSISAIFIGFYIAYQYYYDYYVRDRIFYNQIYLIVKEEEKEQQMSYTGRTRWNFSSGRWYVNGAEVGVLRGFKEN